MSEPMYCNQAIARSPVRWPSVDEACLQVHKTTMQGAGESGCGTASQSARRKWPWWPHIDFEPQLNRSISSSRRMDQLHKPRAYPQAGNGPKGRRISSSNSSASPRTVWCHRPARWSKTKGYRAILVDSSKCVETAANVTCSCFSLLLPGIDSTFFVIFLTSIDNSTWEECTKSCSFGLNFSCGCCSAPFRWDAILRPTASWILLPKYSMLRCSVPSTGSLGDSACRAWSRRPNGPGFVLRNTIATFASVL